MRNVGNERFNARFEAHIPADVAKPRKTSDRDSRERFIKAKYVEKKFFDWPTETDKDFLSAVRIDIELLARAGWALCARSYRPRARNYTAGTVQ